MKSITIILLSLAIILSIGIFVFSNLTKNEKTGFAAFENSNSEIQKITLSMRNFNYYPGTFKVKANIPVEINLDKSVTGCLRSFSIRDFGIKKYLKSPEDKVTFIPTNKGTFPFSCSMGMAYGKMIVE